MWNKLFRNKRNSELKNSHELKSKCTFGWIDFDNGNSIGTKGSENGEITFDIEHSAGARITVEKDCGNIPFAITIGIYGVMFHTAYITNALETEIKIKKLKSIIEEIFRMYNSAENERNEEWSANHDELLNRITQIDSI